MNTLQKITMSGGAHPVTDFPADEIKELARSPEFRVRGGYIAYKLAVEKRKVFDMVAEEMQDELADLETRVRELRRDARMLRGAQPPHRPEGDGPTAKVWAISDSMAGERRKDIIAACVAQGISKGTAGTYYQKWRQAQG